MLITPLAKSLPGMMRGKVYLMVGWGWKRRSYHMSSEDPVPKQFTKTTFKYMYRFKCYIYLSLSHNICINFFYMRCLLFCLTLNNFLLFHLLWLNFLLLPILLRKKMLMKSPANIGIRRDKESEKRLLKVRNRDGRYFGWWGRKMGQ